MVKIVSINQFSRIEQEAGSGQAELFRLDAAMLFIGGSMSFASSHIEGAPGGFMHILTGMMGAYMAISILVCSPLLMHQPGHDAVARDSFHQLLDLIDLLVLIDWSDYTVCTIFGSPQVLW